MGNLKNLYLKFKISTIQYPEELAFLIDFSLTTLDFCKFIFSLFV